jgi:amino acid efflux transporter
MGSFGVARGTALYVGALMGPGLLLVPGLALDAAGPASVVAWGALLVLSAPLAATFVALGMRHPVAGGVAAYVRAAFGPQAAAATGACFLAAVLLGGGAVALVGGFYVADLTGSGTSVAVAAAAVMCALVLAANLLGIRVSSGAQLVLSAVLVVVLAVAIAVALPEGGAERWEPFAPDGWWAVGTAANLLVWHFIGWEAMAQLAGEFRDPARQLPRAAGLAFAAVAVLYCGLAVATVAVGAGDGSTVPLADLLAAGFGEAGRNATVVLAVALTMGTMNVYLAGGAHLAADLAREGALPAWVTGRRPLGVWALFTAAVLAALGTELVDASLVVRATSACFVAVYVLVLAGATRILDGRARAAAVVALALVAVVAAFSGWLLLVPLAASAVVLARPAHRLSLRRVG